MTTFVLTKCWPVPGLHGGTLSANRSIAEVEAGDKQEAIEKLQFHCPAKMDESGYVKIGFDTWVVAERWNPLEDKPRKV